MTLINKVHLHKLSPNATLCASGFNLVAADSPAIEWQKTARAHAASRSPVRHAWGARAGL